VKRAYVKRLDVQNYGCIKDAKFELSPLHALIGPNDSGKSTVLRALRTVAHTAAGPGSPDGLVQAFYANATRGPVSIGVSTGSQYWRLAIAKPPHVLEERYQNGAPVGQPQQSGVGQFGRFTLRTHSLGEALLGARLLRLDPDSMRVPGTLIPDEFAIEIGDEHGGNLPGVYDALMNRNLESFLEISQRLATLFPGVKSLNLRNISTTEKMIGVALKDGTWVPAPMMSEGLLYWLAIAVVPHLSPTSLLLVEEPENGLHPSRIADVMKVLRAMSDKTQVIIATHSPLVINELQPDEVTLVTRDASAGTRAVLMKDTVNFEERSKVYALGELWLSYANGVDEKPLVSGDPAP
jgi:ABC-type uncharacterized transport system ATPase subunit